MKVYVVTAGCYSDYHIAAVFTDEDTAHAFANMDTDREVEEYDTDSVKIETAPIKAKITYRPDTNEIKGIRTDDYIQGIRRQMHDTFEWNCFTVYRNLSARTLNDIQKHGKKSQLLLKSMQDAWAIYKAEHIDELKEDDEGKWISVTPEEGAKIFKGLANRYNILFASTSMEKAQCDPFKADAIVNEIVNDFFKDGIKLPTSEDMRELRKELVKRTAEENVSINEQDELR